MLCELKGLCNKTESQKPPLTSLHVFLSNYLTGSKKSYLLQKKEDYRLLYKKLKIIKKHVFFQSHGNYLDIQNYY